MKRIFTIAISIPAVLLFAFLLSILLLAATGRGETNSVTITTNNNPVIDAFTQACSTNGFDTSGFIRKLAASGEICKVFGHWWPRFNDNALYVINNCVVTKYRTCRICGKCESKSEGNWK